MSDRVRQKKSKTKKWLNKVGIGCLVFLLACVIALSVGNYFMMEPFKQGISSRETLEEQFGSQANYSPEFDGSITPQRMEVFLTVRERLMSQCGEFAEVFGQFEQLDKASNEDSTKDAFKQMGKAFTSMLRMGPLTGRFFLERNTALLEEGMGLGEYTHIYTLAYHEKIRPTQSTVHEPVDDQEPSRIQQVHIQTLRNQQQVIVEKIDRDGDSDGQLVEINQRLIDEIQLFDTQPDRLPWQDGLLPAATKSLDPFRDRLDVVFCKWTLDFEFVQNNQSLIGIQGD